MLGGNNDSFEFGTGVEAKGEAGEGEEGEEVEPPLTVAMKSLGEMLGNLSGVVRCLCAAPPA